MANNPDGKMLDGIGLLAGARVYIEDDSDPNTVDTIPITDLNELANKEHHILHYLQTMPEEMEQIFRQIEWGFYPIFGYFNPNNEYRIK